MNLILEFMHADIHEQVTITISMGMYMNCWGARSPDYTTKHVSGSIGM